MEVFSIPRAMFKEPLSALQMLALQAISKFDDEVLEWLSKHQGYDLEIRDLQEKGYIKIQKDKYILRKKALSLFSQPKKLGYLHNVEEWIDDWRALFPAGISSTGYRYRGVRAKCVENMIDIIRNNKVSRDDIFEATKAYVDRFRLKNYQYMMQAHYFVKKQGIGSTLLSEIEGLQDTKKLKSIMNQEDSTYGTEEL